MFDRYGRENFEPIEIERRGIKTGTLLPVSFYCEKPYCKILLVSFPFARGEILFAKGFLQLRIS